MENELRLLRDKSEDQENSNHLQNLHMKNFKKGKRREDLRDVVLKWIQDLCLDLKIMLEELRRAHRGSPKQEAAKEILL